MPDITQIKVGSTTYDIRDAVARTSLSTKANAADVYTTTQIDTALNLKAPLSSPAFTGTPTAPTATDGTNTTQIATTQFVQNAFKTNDAMVFKGTIGSSGATVTTLPTTHYQGWTYKVATAGSYVGTTCEVGDMIICVTDGTSANNAHWTVIQTNVDGAVTGPASATDAHIAVFNGTSGKIIKDSGFTIGKSVPSDAKFTDTTYNNATTTTAGLMSTADKTKLDGIASGANNYSLPTASSSTKGGIKIGSNLSMSGEVLNATDTTYTNGNGITLSGTTFSAAFPTSGTPAALGTASNGSANTVARSDHVHAKPTYSKSDVGLGNVTNDVQVKASLGTTTGDILYWSAASTPARLGIGSNGQVLKVVSGVPAWSSDNNTDVNVTNTLANTTKYYITGTSNSSTNTGTQVFDSGIYSTTTSGQLNATTYKVNEQVTLQWNSADQSLDFVFA